MIRGYNSIAQQFAIWLTGAPLGDFRPWWRGLEAFARHWQGDGEAWVVSLEWCQARNQERDPLVMTFTVRYWKWPSRNREFSNSFPIKNGDFPDLIISVYQSSIFFNRWPSHTPWKKVERRMGEYLNQRRSVYQIVSVKHQQSSHLKAYTSSNYNYDLSSGKRTVCYGKSPCWIGTSTIHRPFSTCSITRGYMDGSKLLTLWFCNVFPWKMAYTDHFPSYKPPRKIVDFP